MRFRIIIILLAFCSISGFSKNTKKQKTIIRTGNPILPGDFADPCLLQYKDAFYLYATVWDNKDAIGWYSSNFIDWKMRKLNWTTTSPGSTIWTPCVVKGKDGRFFFYSATGSSMYVGVANHPMGLFKDLLPNEKPLIKNRQYWDIM